MILYGSHRKPSGCSTCGGKLLVSCVYIDEAGHHDTTWRCGNGHLTQTNDIRPNELYDAIGIPLRPWRREKAVA